VEGAGQPGLHAPAGRGLLAAGGPGGGGAGAGVRPARVGAGPADPPPEVRRLMTAVEYPWRWLTDCVGTSFVLRYPWVEAARLAASRSPSPVCILRPGAAGDLGGWGAWLAALLAREDAPPSLSVGGDFAEVRRALGDAFLPAEEAPAGPAGAWANAFLAACRR